MNSWHARTLDDVLQQLESGRSGLSNETASARLARVGPNRLPRAKPVPAVVVLADQFKSVVVLLLVAAAVVSLALGDRVETAAVVAVLAINTLIGFATEIRARRAMEALLHFDVGKAAVMRSGRLQSVDAATVVPGDVIHLRLGHLIPADARLIDTSDLRTDESALTGESMPVEKRPEAQLDPGTPLADRANMVYKGTIAAAGTATAVVTGTGSSTEIGRIGRLVGAIDAKRTPLERRLDQLGRRLVWVALAVAALVAALGAWQGTPLGLVVQTGIALAVAAVPEALPAVATIALAVGVHRMARRRALVRRLPAVEALGSATVVCTDKTKTLTSGDMTLMRVWTAEEIFEVHAASVPSQQVRLALEVAVLASQPQPLSNSDAKSEGDPIDRAVLEAAVRAGVDRNALLLHHPQAAMVPFASSRQFMASLHGTGALTAYVKGAPRRVLSMSQRIVTRDGEERPLDDAQRQQMLEANDTMASGGLRVLAVGRGSAAGATEADIRGLTFVGLIGFADPPAEGVKEAIARLRAAGLRTVMLTGDQRATAGAVGRELGLLELGQTTVDGREVEAMSDDDLKVALRTAVAFSRITPEHKLRLVRALQDAGEIVAMLGDGVNDAPALRQADIGVAMGLRGTDVAKEAAGIVLQNDRFDTIVAAVEEGRVIFGNIRKFVFYLFSCNVGEVLVLLIAAVADLPIPLLPLQILWLNMVTDTFPALALALEPADDDVMSRRPRDPAETLLSRRFLASVLAYALLIAGATLGAFLLYVNSAIHKAQTMAFVTLAVAQLLHLGNARTNLSALSIATITSNPYALAALGVSIVLQVMAVDLAPLASVLGAVHLEGRDWLVAFSFGAVPAVVGEAIKLISSRSVQRG